MYITGVDLFLGGRIEGREAVPDYSMAVLDGLDRRFESRELELMEGPIEEGETVRIRGSATYRAAGVPDLAAHTPYAGFASSARNLSARPARSKPFCMGPPKKIITIGARTPMILSVDA